MVLKEKYRVLQGRVTVGKALIRWAGRACPGETFHRGTNGDLWDKQTLPDDEWGGQAFEI